MVFGRGEGDRSVGGQGGIQADTGRRQCRIESIDGVDVTGGNRAGDDDGDRRARGGRKHERLSVEGVGAAIGKVGRRACNSQGTGAGRRSGGGGSLHRISTGALQSLVGDRLGGVDQLLQRGEPGVGGLQYLHAVADRIEQIADVAGAIVERGRGEIIGGIVEGRVDLLAGRETILGGGKQIGGRLQREQVLANRRRENNARHGA